MASPVKSNPPHSLLRLPSLRSATTTDGYSVMASKHYTYQIENGTLKDGIRKGYIDSFEALKARTTKARSIGREILDMNRRAVDEPKAPEAAPTQDAASTQDTTPAAPIE
jgi:hypothetical protein